MIAAQPIIREGLILLKRANHIAEAIAIAKDNPEFEYIPSASIEVRPIKVKEEQTNFVYPAS